MAKHESGFFWGVLAGVAAVAIAGAMALTRSFRTSRDGGGSWDVKPKGQRKPRSSMGKIGRVRSKR